METRTQQPFLIPNALPFIQPTERIGKQRVGGAYVVAWWKAQATTRRSDLETHFFSTIPRTVTPPLCSETSAPRLLLTNHERDRWKRNYRVSRRFIARLKKKKKKRKQDSSISNFQFVSSYPQYFSLPRSLINRDSWPLPSKGWRIYSICSEMEQEHRGNHRRIAWIDPVN